MKEETLSPDAEQEETKDSTEEEEPSEDDALPTSSDDPLDDLSEEELRLKAKEYRTSYHKVKDQRDELKKAPKEEKPVQPETPYMTKKDWELSNERKAIRKAWEEEEIKSNWDEIKGLYVNRHGRVSEDDIIEDIRDAHLLWKAKQPPKNTKEDLEKTSVTNPTGKTSEEKPKSGLKVLSNKKTDLREKWYGKLPDEESK